MPTKKKPQHPRKKTLPSDDTATFDDLFDRCLRNGLIEKTSYGYYFKPEFFDTLALYNEE